MSWIGHLIKLFTILCILTSVQGCRDEKSVVKCLLKKGLGWCNGLIFGRYMRKYCRWTCGFCYKPPPTRPPRCQDLHDLCSYWKSIGRCNAPLVALNCPLTCFNCESPPTKKTTTTTATTTATTTTTTTTTTTKSSTKAPTATSTTPPTTKATPTTAMSTITTSTWSSTSSGIGTTAKTTKKTTNIPYQCGLPSITRHSNILMNSLSKPNQWPWHASIFRNNRFHCSGVLIKSLWIITSAHCLTGNKTEYKIVLGDNDLSQVSFNEQVFKIDKVIKHDKYNGKDHDIALLKLDKAVILSRSVQPICLKTSQIPIEAGQKCFVTGWRSTNNPVGLLRYTGAKVINNNSCIKQNSKVFQVTKNQLCVQNNQHLPCFGEIGSPLVCQEHNGRWYLQGFKTWRPSSCINNTYYDVHTRISEYLIYIETKITS